MSEQYPPGAVPGGALPPPGTPPLPPPLQLPSFAAPPPPPSPLAPPDGGLYAAPPKRSRKGRVLLAAIGAVAVLGGATFAAVALSGSDGAATPSAAVAGFFDALDHEDVLGVLDALPSGERDALRPLAEELNSELTRLKITTKIDLGQVKGVDIHVEGLKTHSDDLGDGVAAVWIDDGTISVNVVPQDVPIGDNLKNLIEHFTGNPVEITASSDSTTMHMEASDSPIVTIKDGGSWKLSAFYTFAESARRDTDAALPAFGQGVNAIGSDSPEAAVTAFADALAAFDVEKLVALTPPEEMRALHDYAPLFLPDVEATIESTKNESGVKVTIDSLDLSTSGSGDRRTVAINGAQAHVESPEGTAAVSYDGDCVTITGDLANDGSGGSEKACRRDIDQAAGGLGDLGDRLTEPLGITVVKEHGEWYVSPIGTVGDLALTVTRVLEPADFEEGGLVYKLIEGIQNAEGDVFGALGGSNIIGGSLEGTLPEACRKIFDPKNTEPPTDEEQAACQKALGGD